MRNLNSAALNQDEILVQTLVDACDFDSEINESPIRLDVFEIEDLNILALSMQDFRKSMGYSK